MAKPSKAELPLSRYARIRGPAIVADAQDKPTPPGAVTRDVTTLKAGDCTEAVPDGRVLDVPVIDCASCCR